MQKPPRQLFMIGSQVLDSLSREEVWATWRDMAEMGIEKPPVPNFDVKIPGEFYYGRLIKECDDLASLVKKEGGTFNPKDHEPVGSFLHYEYTFRFCVENGSVKSQHSLQKRGLRFSVDTEPVALDLGSEFGVEQLIYRAIIVLLATRNVIRETKIHKLAKLGIGKNVYSRTTTIRLGTITETAGDQIGSGVAVRPHLRRGHIRHQHYGPGGEFIKKIFIEAVFVNADQGWISERTAYNVIGPKNQEELAA